ncbi:MAG: hypothetical protein CME63_08930 [Halobacteriovoraceae bacterium]|nr:hypothetical protein [Halobacteriovoraceae bacterium]MBC97861.1 hypothetical protein [Halobacteriovoraceae bacterium]|tara:strand:- start:48935 stop:52342 length:3408 start_codon:yes stop_codon:yes gene_type:complete
MKQAPYSHAYLQTPSYNKEKDILIFSTDDDLWRTSLQSNSATFRLTHSKGSASDPFINHDGSLIAYLDTYSGQKDIYLVATEGGLSKRITFKGVQKICGWKDKKTLIYTSNAHSFSQRVTYLYSIHIETLEIKDLNLGHASALSTLKNLRVLGRNTGDPARWKRYRGGTAGTLWLESTEGKTKGEFKQILKSLKTNLANPQWIHHQTVGKNPRLFFISDHEGIGNIYSCNQRGTQVKRHTNCEKYYVRNFCYDDGTLIYQAGADLYKHDLQTGGCEVLTIQVPSPFNQSLPRIEEAEDYLQEYTLNSEATKLGLITRGQIFVRSPWSHAPIHLGDVDKRYKQPTFIESKSGNQINKGLLAVELNDENEETLKFFSYDTKDDRYDPIGESLFAKKEWGKIQNLCVHPKEQLVVLSNNRNQLFLINLKTKKTQLICENRYHYYDKFSWSPCGQYLAYSEAINRTTHELRLYNLKSKKARTLIPSVLTDSNPIFDPNGEYLYFVGIREFHPNYSETHFELSFPFASKVYAIALQKDLPSPLEQYENFEPQDPENDSESESDTSEEHLAEEKQTQKKKVSKKGSKKTSTTKKVKKVSKESSKESEKESPTPIDWDGIEDRIFSLPLPLGGYREIAVVEDKIFILKESVKGLNPLRSHPSIPTLYTFCLKEKKLETYQKGCHGFELSAGQKYILMDTEDDLRLVSTEGKPSDGEEYNKKDGHIDLSNIRLYIEPKKEWKQMYQEAWILQREHFWTEDMNRIDWQEVYLRYLDLLPKVHTRKELSDLMWEMQGELGTSHCYEFGGDYHRRPKNHSSGHLGADLNWNEKTKTFTIKSLPKGDSWISESSSPLRQSGVYLNEGDLILGMDGRPFQSAQDLNLGLMGRNGKKVLLEVKRKGAKKSESVEIKVRYSHHMARYRDWVNKNKEYVHKMSKGKVGYVHIPDMGVHGFSEFYRNFLSECTKEGLIVDVRYNGGGHVSQHILKILAQKVVGFDKTRYMDIEPYPAYAINGPIVALTNEHAGSDGDIFSHSFKLMNIGPLIGKRTWGGVVGIWPRHPLNDGTITSQPEFSFWFKDVGYQVENYGTDPDIEVENTPQDWSKGLDKQLEKAIEEVQKRSKKNPPLRPNLNKDIPNLKAPKLPK